MRRICSILAACATLAGLSCLPAWAFRIDVSGFKPGGPSLEGGRRVRFLGPLVEWQTAPDGRRFFALRPFYSCSGDPSRERTERHFLWPVADSKRMGNDLVWRCLVAYGHDFDTSDPGARYRFWFLPFLFWGRDAGGRGYFAVFPLGGTIREFLTQDEIFFALFPLYGSSTVNGHTTHALLWPLIARTRTDKTYRFRFLPFYSRTSLPDVESRSYLWPLWSASEYNAPGKSGRGYLLFPLFGRVKREDQSTWMFLPPLFRFSKSARLNEANFPWPVFRTASGKEDKFFFWPIWGYKNINNESSSFLLWPIVTTKRVQSGNRLTRKLKILPIVFHRSVTRTRGQGAAATNEVIERDFHLWPLTGYTRIGDDATFRMLDLWPLHNKPIDRNWAPLWTLYSRHRLGDAIEDDFLWGLYYHARKPDVFRRFNIFPLVAWQSSTDNGGSVEWSILKGLFGRSRRGDRSSYRMLYTFRFGD